MKPPMTNKIIPETNVPILWVLSNVFYLTQAAIIPTKPQITHKPPKFKNQIYQKNDFRALQVEFSTSCLRAFENASLKLFAIICSLFSSNFNCHIIKLFKYNHIYFT
ncbi:hypothetical protein [Mycoplasmopsis fermentans]|uniref:hypothetical protein n=1 Tax=Mycoplasmopsis fermentans TaxID=2115 RepID=UPI0001E32EE3|nr:hypothetical protein [Mycoplasmopsis fermentans]ADN69145.1 hypothetical membrane spanning protein [Mycoplasmopsis fermentans JER]